MYLCGEAFKPSSLGIGAMNEAPNQLFKGPFSGCMFKWFSFAP